MEKQHEIHAEIVDLIKDAIKLNRHWMAYNTASYFLEKGDLFFFNNKEESEEFCANNISEYDLYNSIQLTSIDEVLQKITGDQQLINNLERQERKGKKL